MLSFSLEVPAVYDLLQDSVVMSVFMAQLASTSAPMNLTGESVSYNILVVLSEVTLDSLVHTIQVGVVIQQWYRL